MTNKLSPEQIAEMSEDCQCSCKELEQYKVWWERDSTALGKALNEVSSLRAVREESRAAIEQLHAAVKTAQELAATRLMEIDRLREVLTIPNITLDTTSSALFIRTLSEHEKGQPVNGQDLINALMWRVKNQRKEIARLQEKRGSDELCPHGMPLADNTCGPCSKGKPNGNEPKPCASFLQLWQALNNDVNAVPCQWPDLRDSLHDWLRSRDEKKSQGASRDASSDPLQGASFPMSNERSHELAEWLRNNWAGHSMMMEIASMLQKDRGCPMANKYTFRSLGMLGQMYDPIGMEVNFPNDTEFYLASDIASSAQRTGAVE